MNKNIKSLDEYGVKPMRINDCKTETVIRIDYIQGEGTKENPIQKVTEYRTLSGEVIGSIIF